MRRNEQTGFDPKKPNPTSGLSREDRERYLREARRREQQRRRRSLGKRLQKKERKQKGHTPPDGAHVLTDNWLENRTLDEERAKPIREIPAWLFPLSILLALVLSLFVVIPLVVTRLADQADATEPMKPGLSATVYEEEYMVAKKSVVDVFSSANLRSERITQLLYNEPVYRLGPKQSNSSFVKVRLSDGTEGYCKRADLEEDTESIEPDGTLAKLVVTDLSKRVLSHARNGNLLVEVKMNTELYVLYHSEPLYRVKLPGGQEGWLDSTGVLELPSDGKALVAGASYFSDSILAFNYVTYLPHGVSNEGISIPSAIRIAASVNGVDLGPGIRGIEAAATPLDNLQTENGTLNMNAFQRGDILFFSDEEGGEITRLAVWVDYGIVLAERPREFLIRETEIQTILSQWVFVKAGRLFLN